MADKFLQRKAGSANLQENEFSVASAGAGDAGKAVALDGSGRLSVTVMPSGISADTSSPLASENLTAGDFINVYNNAGVANVRKADGSGLGKPATGFVLAAVISGQNATVYHSGENNQVTGATVGEVFLSSALAGGSSSSTPLTAGQTLQSIGMAVSATSIFFHPQIPIELA